MSTEQPVRILGIAPYEGMCSMMRRAAESFPCIHLDVFTGDLEQGVEIVRAHSGDGYDAIVSRGGTASMIREITELPVVEIQISVYDVLRSIRLAQNYSNLYAIIGFPNVTEAAHTLCDLLRYDVDILTVHSAAEAEKTLERLQEGGYKMVISDMVTYTAARRMGFDAFLITSGAESLRAAIEQAAAQGESLRRMHREIHMLRGIAKPLNGLTVAMQMDGTVCFATPYDPDETLRRTLKEHCRDLPASGFQRFYYQNGNTLYKVSAERLVLEWEELALFRCEVSQIPPRTGKTGTQILNRSECSQLFMNSFYSISGAMGAMDQQLNAIAMTHQPVLIAGEAGTGKQQIARALYLRGPWQNMPFVMVDCALVDDRNWNYLLNHHASPLNEVGGTIYFQHLEALTDERARALLAQALETDLTRRKRVLFSCVCREGEPLPKLGKDFAARLGCLTLHLPALRTRADEIPSLASLYLSSLNPELGRQISGFDPHAIELLVHYSWPNNYTQFKQVLQELATLTESSYIRGSAVAELLDKERMLNGDGTSHPAPEGKDRRTLDEITLDAVRAAVAANDGNHSAAARQLGISRTTLWRLLNRSESATPTNSTSK